MELFLDLYGNCMIRDKTDAYLQGVVNELIQLVTEDDRCQSVLKDFINFDQLKFKERDEIEDVLSSWYSTHEYDIEKNRDTGLRAHFKDRYDFRRNMCDWDFGMYLSKLTPLMNKREYIAWRLTGTAFEARLAKNTTPNRTLSSYVPGRDVSVKPKLMVSDQLYLLVEKNKRQHLGPWFLGRYHPITIHSIWS